MKKDGVAAIRKFDGDERENKINERVEEDKI
jgi:hypothetical protein